MNKLLSIALVLALVLPLSFVSAEEGYGVLTGTVTLSQPAPSGGVSIVVVVNTVPGSSGGVGGGGGPKMSWQIAEQPDATSLTLSGKLNQTITIPEGQTSATYSFSYEELEAKFSNATSVRVGAYVENGYGISAWATKYISNIKYGNNVVYDISLQYQPFYHISGKVQLSTPCVRDEVFTLYAESNEFVSTTQVTVVAGGNEAQYTLDVISGQEYTMKLFADPYSSFYNDAVRGTKYTITDTNVQNVNFVLFIAFQSVRGTLKLPDGYPSAVYDQNYTVRLSSGSYWLGQDIVTIKQGERTAEFLIPNRVGVEKAVISWGLGDEATDFYSNGATIVAYNVLYPIIIVDGEEVSTDPRQWLDFSDLPDNIEIIPTLSDNKLFNIECYYDTFDKYDEITDMYSGTEIRISEITVTRSVPLPQTAYLCAYTAQGKLLGVVSLPTDEMQFTISANGFSRPQTIATLRIFLWNNVLRPVYDLPTVNVTPPH
jgi:hypothetical protein